MPQRAALQRAGDFAQKGARPGRVEHDGQQAGGPHPAQAAAQLEQPRPRPGSGRGHRRRTRRPAPQTITSRAGWSSTRRSGSTRKLVVMRYKDLETFHR